MPPSLQIGLLVLGGILVLIGIVGGNFKLFGAELTATISSRFLRFIAFVFGTALIVAALSSGAEISSQSPSGANSPSSSPSTYQMSPDKVKETVRSASDAESAGVVIGHWSTTTIVFEKPKDVHLVLDANGAAATWEVTASTRSGKRMGTWSVEGKNLTLRLEGNIVSSPFTIYQGQLVLPNIQNHRRFWEKIAQ